MASLSAKLGGKERGYRDMKTEHDKITNTVYIK